MDGNKTAILILGGGPAGAAVALGMAARGYAVTLIGEPRRFHALEGISERVVAALRSAGLVRALEAVALPSPRVGTWNGETRAANTERLVDRPRFDAGLLADVALAGVRVVRGTVRRVEHDAAGWAVHYDDADGCTQCGRGDFLVEARGRAAPFPGASRLRGAETVSLLQHWQGPPRAHGSAVESLEDGWAWMGALSDGRRYLQLTLDVASAALPAKAALGAYCRARFAAIAAAQSFIADASPEGPPHARTSTPVLSGEVIGSDWIRVGDAAMAVDPLSGNGIFQALSSALQAPAVIATLCERPAQAALAMAFHRERIMALFMRFARIGRDFYALETRWPAHPFWVDRRAWPDTLPSHPAVTPGEVTIARRPVIDDGFIREAEVVVTPDQPLGIWHLDGRPLAPLLQVVRAGAAAGAIDRLVATGIAPADSAHILGWMRQNGWT